MIIFGAYPYNSIRGFVGDYCHYCGGPQVFHLMDHYELPHVYFIPFARLYQMTVRICQGCGSEEKCKRNAYAQVVPQRRGRGMEVEEVLAETNAPLHALVLVERQAATTGEDRERAVRAMRVLQKHHGRREAAPLLQRMQDWPRLGASARQQLLDEIEGLHNLQEQNEEALDFLLEAVKTAPYSAHLLLVLPLFVTVLVVCIGFTAATVQGFAVLGVLLPVLAADILVCFWLYNRLTTWRYRRWVRAKLIPMAEEEGMDFLAICAALSGEWPKEVLEQPRFAILRKQQKTVIDVLVEEGKLPSDVFAD